MDWLNGPAGESMVVVSTVVFGALLVLLVVAVEMFVVWDGVRQMVGGRYAFLPIDRILRNRLPATSADCVLQGAGRVFGSIGVFLVVVPGFINGAAAAADLIGITRMGTEALVVMLAGFVICWPVGIALGVASMLVNKRVNYRYLDAYEA